MKKILCFFMIIGYVFAFNFDEIKLVRGEARVIKLGKNDKINLKSSHTIYKINGKNLLIIPIHYKSKQDFINLCVNNICKDLKIHNGEYKQTQIKEQVSVAQSKVAPDKKMQERIAKELQIANKAYATKTLKTYISKAFKKPLDSFITSPFGSARVFNGVLKSYHSGTDFRASIGTKIHSSNAGLVVIADDRYYAGKSVVIDHGFGVFSQYYHLDEILVKKGDIVKHSELIGKSGATGRVSGPHLHLGVAINGISVNPLKFFEEFNKKAFDEI